jgi:hypothetical protein
MTAGGNDMNDDHDSGMGMAPKRRGPPEVEPVRLGELEIRALHWGRRAGLPQNGGYIEAWRAHAQQPEWRLRVYETQYDGAMEEDVQDCFIEHMSLTPQGTLLVRDEDGREYAVDPTRREVREI